MSFFVDSTSAITAGGGGVTNEGIAQVTASMEGMAVENKRRSTIQNDNTSDNTCQGTDFLPEGTMGGDTDTVNYDAKKMVGHGSFGAVFLANVVETGEVVAIKKVLQDKRFKNRELKIMRELVKLPHPYIVPLRHYFISKGNKPDEVSGRGVSCYLFDYLEFHISL